MAKIIRDGSSYRKDRAVVVPKGVVEIRSNAFKAIGGDFDEVSLPSTLKKIGDHAFAMLRWNGDGRDGKILSVVIPPSVTDLGYGAFCGFDRITVYDTINPDAHLKLDGECGITDATVGWLGTGGDCLFYRTLRNTTAYDFEVTVRSAATDDVKHRVFMPLGSASGDLKCVYASSWGSCGHFEFGNVDSLFDKLPSKKIKLRTAINRLLWPVGLAEDARKAIEAYAKRFSKDVVKMLADEDDVDALRALAFLGLITEKNAAELVLYAETVAHAPQVRAFISSFDRKAVANACEGSEGRSRKAGGKRSLAWNTTRTRELLTLVEAGDIARIEEYMSHVGGGALPEGEVEKGWRVPKHHAQMWETCCKRFDVDLMGFLAAKGLDIPKADVGRSASKQSVLLNALESLSDDRDIEQAKRFTVEAVKVGVRFKKVRRSYFAALYMRFGEDEGFYDLLFRADLSFDTSDLYLVGDLRLDSEDRPWAAAYLLNHGVRVIGFDWPKDQIWSHWRRNPSQLANLIPLIPVGSIKPEGEILELVASAGDVGALEALAGWPASFAETGFLSAVSTAADEGHSEAAAWLLENKDRLLRNSARTGLAL